MAVPLVPGPGLGDANAAQKSMSTLLKNQCDFCAVLIEPKHVDAQAGPPAHARDELGPGPAGAGAAAAVGDELVRLAHRRGALRHDVPVRAHVGPGLAGNLVPAPPVARTSPADQYPAPSTAHEAGSPAAPSSAKVRPSVALPAAPGT